MKKRYLLLLLLSFSYLLYFPEYAVPSAREGLILWYQSVLPVLFPFMLLCTVFLQSGTPEILPAVLCKPLCRLFGCSAYGAFIILAGFLCGFPMGAKLTGDLLRQNKISRTEARFLYGFVNNLSPGFIISYIAADQLNDPSLGPVLLVPILGSALLYGLLTSIRFRKNRKTEKQRPDSAAPDAQSSESSFFLLFDECVFDTIRSVVRLGAYIVIFCIISHALTRILPLRKLPCLLFASSIEVTNGVRLIAESSLIFWWKYLLITAVCTFGGLSAIAQSIGISNMDGELLSYYIKSRVITTLLSVFLSLCSVLFSVLFL